MDVKRWIVTGWRGSGKTMFCQSILNVLKSENRDVAGIISTGSFVNGVKQSIGAIDLRTGNTEPLANLTQQDPSDYNFGGWYFNQKTLDWGNTVFQSSVPCQLLMVDELGPLELVLGQGWVKALDVIQSNRYDLAMIVIRPELLDMAKNLFLPSAIIQLEYPDMVPDRVNEYFPIINKLIS